MNPVNVTITGADEVARRIGSLSRHVDDLRSTYDNVAGRVAAEARALAPRRTGRLAASPIASATPRAGGVTTRGVPYAGVINFGWARRGIAASLFMQRAADNKGPSTADQLGAEIQRQINRTGLA